MNSFEPSPELKNNYYDKDLISKKLWYSNVVEAYDRVRPRYSDLIIDLAIKHTSLSAGDKILEIGCASGIATTSFAKRDFKLVCLEPNSQACQLAKQNCAAYDVEICQTTVEEWSLIPQEFAAVVAATSLHWVSPEIGYPKLAQALKPHGFLILLWNAGMHPDREVSQLLEPIYKAYTPSLKPFKEMNRERKELAALGQTVVDSGYFNSVFSEELIFKANYSLEDYLLLLSTYSPYIALAAEQRKKLFDAIVQCLDKTEIANSSNQQNRQQLALKYLSVLQIFQAK